MIKKLTESEKLSTSKYESSKGNELHSSRRIVFRIIANDKSDGNVNAIITSFEINNK